MSRSGRLMSAVLLAAGWLADCGPAQAAKFMTAQIERDGKPLLQATFGVPDLATPAEAWSHLDGLPWKGIGPLEPGPGQAQEISLTGDLRISIRHGQTPTAVATVDKLRLLRGQDGEWRLPKEEVERTARAAGLEVIQPTTTWFLPLAAVLAIAVLLAAVLLIRKRLRSDV